jgi:hypothetical protein
MKMVKVRGLLSIKPALVLAACLAGLVAACIAGILTAPPARADTTQNGIYMVNQTIYTGNTWTILLPAVEVARGQTAVTVVYQNISSSPQQLVCSQPIQQTSITLNGTVYTESDSYCARNPGKLWMVPAHSKFPSWAKYNVVPGLAQPFTLNNWWGWGGVQNIQLVPFSCIDGPNGSCMGIPNSVPSEWMPTPPEWLTSGETGACFLDVATFGEDGYVEDLYTLWIGGLGGAIRVQEPPGTASITKVWIVLTSAMPFGSCADLGAQLIGQALPTDTQTSMQQLLNYPLLTAKSS